MTIAVLGAGVAGSATCLRLLSHGVEPLWLASEAGSKAKPGEYLSPSGHSLLQELQIEHLIQRDYHRPSHRVLSCWGSTRPSERNSILHLEGPGFILDRLLFERDLRSEVESRGVSCEAAKIERVERVGSGWLISGSTGRTWQADAIFDATGRRALVAREESHNCRLDKLIALYAFSSSQNPSAMPATLLESVKDGWWYSTLLADGRLALYYFCDSDLVEVQSTRSIERFIERVQDTQLISSWISQERFRFDQAPHVASACTSWQAPCSGPGWIAVGDAAASFDPLSSHGMTTALWTGVRAADAYLAGSEEVEKYSLKVMLGVQDFLQSHSEIYAMERRFQDSEFWKRRCLNLL